MPFDSSGLLVAVCSYVIEQDGVAWEDLKFFVVALREYHGECISENKALLDAECGRFLALEFWGSL